METKNVLARRPVWLVDGVRMELAEESGNVPLDRFGKPEVASRGSAGIGDVDSQERGSGARYNQGKPDWSLMPLPLLEEVVRVWEYGAKKYAAWNWAKGMPWSVPYSCMVRHARAWWWNGERNDPESGYSHLAHIICNVMMLMHFETKYKEGDDRPKEFRD